MATYKESINNLSDLVKSPQSKIKDALSDGFYIKNRWIETVFKRVPDSLNLSRKYSQSDEIINDFKFLADLPIEHFYVFYLTTRLEVLGLQLAGIGSVLGTEIDIRNVTYNAIQLGSTAVIFLHNHPSGDSEPSKPDKIITNKFKAIFELFGITLVDHIIIAYNNYYSFADNRLIT